MPMHTFEELLEPLSPDEESEYYTEVRSQAWEWLCATLTALKLTSSEIRSAEMTDSLLCRCCSKPALAA